MRKARCIYIYFFIISPTNKVREKIKRLFLLLGWIALSSAFNQWRGPDIRTIAYCACETMKSLSVEELTLNIVKRERIRFVKKMFRGIKRETMYTHSYASPRQQRSRQYFFQRRDSLIFISGKKQFKRKRSVFPGFVSSLLAAYRRIPAISSCIHECVNPCHLPGSNLDRVHKDASKYVPTNTGI